MVSTRQMTGGSSDECGLHSFRVTSNASSLAISGSNTTSSSTNMGTTSCGKVSSFGLHGLALPSANNNVTTMIQDTPSPEMHLTVRQLQHHPKQEISLMDLPAELLGHIFSFVGFKKIAQMRVISHQMNHVCSSILNSTFQKLQNQMHNRFHTVKAKMPRRESARRNHPLACECDILETCYMRLSLLQMTFGKHIERKHCCFFPGAILDEVYSVLRYIRTSPALDRPFKVTDELFDLSTMAMEYFKEHIEPNLPDIAYFTNSTKSFAVLEPSSSMSRDTSHSNSSSPPQSNMVLRKGIRKIKQGMKRYNNQLTVLRSELRTCRRKATEQAKTITEQQKLLAEQQKQTLEFANRLDETDKKNEELSRKFSTVLQELNKCKTELQYWRSNSPANTISRRSEQTLCPEELNIINKPRNSDNEVDSLKIVLEKRCPLVGTNMYNFSAEEEKYEEEDKTEQGIDQAKGQRLLSSVPKARAAVTVLANNLTETIPCSSTIVKTGQKRKLGCCSITNTLCYSGDAVMSCYSDDNETVPLDTSKCLNPHFASAALTASYSSTALLHTGSCTMPSFNKGIQSPLNKIDTPKEFGKEDIREDIRVDACCKCVNVENGTSELEEKATDEYESILNLENTEAIGHGSIVVVPLSQDPVSASSNDLLHNNARTNLSNHKTSFITADNIYHNKKLRRVQNKARSPSNKHIKHNAKATRSKQTDK